MNQIICRFDTTKQKPVAFLPALSTGNTITEWCDGVASSVPINHYKNTLPLPIEQAEILCKQYAASNHLQSVAIRHRLPRAKKPVVSLPVFHRRASDPKPNTLQTEIEAMKALKIELDKQIQKVLKLTEKSA